ncbi:MAG: V-type ATPase 116kDa subunit family protein [Thermoproteota archaeon]
MFKPAKMKKVKLQLPLEQEDKLLDDLSKLGILQVKNVEEHIPDLNVLDANIVEEKSNIENLIRRCDAILNRLPKESIFTQLIRKSNEVFVLSKDQEYELYTNAQSILSEAEDKLNTLEKLKKSKIATKEQVSSRISSLLKDNLIVLRKVKETNHMVVFEGWIKRKNVVKLKEIISKTTEGKCIISLEESKVLGKDVLRVRFVTLTSNYVALEGALSRYGIAKFSVEETKEEEPKLESIEEVIDVNSIKQKVSLLKKVLLNRLEIVKAKEKLGRSRFFVYVEGWIKEKDVNKLTSLLKNEHYDYRLSLEDPKEGEEDHVPVALENPPLIRSFEAITTMFGYPKYKQIDPTPFLAITFSLFFGLMFADVFDGLLLLAFSLLLYNGLGSRSQGGRKLSEILIAISFSSIFFGFLFGEFMGGVVKLPVVWFSSFENPMYFLEIAIIIGIAQISIGLVIGFINELIRHRIKNAIGEKLSWLLLLYGIIVILLHFYYLQSNIYFYLGIILAASGVLLIFITKPINLIEITRMISNTVSYARIVAINMSHIGISRAFALLVAPLLSSENGIIGFLLGGVFLLIAHIFIVFIESFVAFAHSLRLHFVEFFSKFFEPSENVFIPLSISKR